jgi:GH25 family lysozyme M1 (1,4-beta-N-acetylmuramidase)
MTSAPSATLAASRPRRHGRVGALVGAAGLAVALVMALAPAASARSVSVSPDAFVTGDATATVVEGIDVSHWQGTINWTKVAAAGKKFAIIKATESTNYIDPMYATNHAAAKAAGLWTGAYHFAQPSTTTNDAVLEADYFAAHINLGAGDLIPALDLEASGGLSVAALQAWVMSFVKEVTAKTGTRPMIYTSPSFWGKYMGNTTALADAGYKTLWVAHWGVTSPTVPANNWGGHGWTFWQYTSDGTVSGISGRVDLDRYNGTDLTPVAYSAFKLAATIPSGPVKQGESSDANVSILRTNFTSEVALTVTGLPAGTTASFNANPTTDTSASLTVTTPADPAATPVGSYPLTISGASGGITRTTKLTLVVADGIPPTLTAPRALLVSNRILSSTSVPVRVAWTASDPSGVASDTLQRSVSGGSWSGVPLATTAATSADSSLPIGASTGYQVRATDRLANTSDWLAGPLVKASVVQQTSSAITWSGTWHGVASSAASGGSVRYATTAGAWAKYAFTGSSIAWVTTRGTTRGKAKVYIDGVYVATVNTWSSSGHSRSIAFAKSWSTSGAHTIRIVVIATAGHPRVDVDAFVRLTPG